METIGDRLRKFGQTNFSNLSEFARALKMSQPAISLYLNNKREPGSGILLRLEHLGCSIDWLLTGKKRIVNIVNSYPVRKNLVMENDDLLEEVLFPYHKRENMYCLYVNENDVILSTKKQLYTVLLIDKERELKENCEVVIRDKKGNEYYKKIHAHDSNKKVFMPVTVSGNPLVLETSEIELLHRVVSKYTKMD